MVVKMIQKISTVDAVVELLTSRIHSGLYVPGNKLPSERKLQDEFGVGRLALREALSRLNALGIIKTSHGKGTFVESELKSSTLKNVLIPYFAQTDSKRLQDLVNARAMIEGEISGLAAIQRTEKDIERLIVILDHSFDENYSLKELADQDLAFHRELALIVDNHFLVLMHEALLAHIKAFLGEFVKSKSGPREVMDPHRPILEAIIRQDAEEARMLSRLHINYSVRDYEEYVKKNNGVN
jgi:DNA-binding FadR family transcriptional regulator